MTVVGRSRTVGRRPATTILALALIIASAFVLAAGAEADNPEMTALDPAVWPITTTLEVDYPAGYFSGAEAGTARWRFAGASWTDWSSELLTGPSAGECQARRGAQELAGTDGCDGRLQELGTIAEEVRGGPSWMLSPSVTTTHQNLPHVALERMPDDARPALRRVGVERDDVLGKVDGAGHCDGADLLRCVPDGSAARMLVHQPTGLIIFHESVVDGERMPTFRLADLTAGR
jgi:hypothetical protein